MPSPVLGVPGWHQVRPLHLPKPDPLPSGHSIRLFSVKISGSPYPQTLQVSSWPRTDHGESHTPLAILISSWMFTGTKLRSLEPTSGILVELLGWRKSFCWISKGSNFKHGDGGWSLYVKEGRISLRIKPTQKKANKPTNRLFWPFEALDSAMPEAVIPWSFRLYESIPSFFDLSQSELGSISCNLMNPKYYTAQYISFCVWIYLWPHPEPRGMQMTAHCHLQEWESLKSLCVLACWFPLGLSCR